MRFRYFVRFALVIALQAGLSVSFFFNRSESLMPFIVAAGFLLPFIGYLLAFYQPAVAAGWSRVALILSIIFVTTIGFFVLLFLTFFLLMIFSRPHWAGASL